METTNFFDTWLSTQNKLISNWVDTTQKMQHAITGGQAMEKGSEIYNEWVTNQMDIMKNTAKTTEQQTSEATSNTTDFFAKWMEGQKEATKKWMEYNQNVMSGFFNNPAANQFNPFQNTQNNWLETYNTWINNWGSPFKSMMENFSSSSSKDAFSNMLNSTNSYFKMFEVWAPMYKSITENGFDPSKFNELFSAEKFKQVMDNTFQFVYPAPLKDAFQNAGQWFEMANNFSKQFSGQYMNQFANFPKAFPGMMFGDNETILNTYNNMFSTFQKSAFPMFRIAAPGKESEMTELYINTLDKFAVYATKLNELQHVMYVAGQKGMEKLITDSYTEFKNSNEPVPYNEFFQKWVDTTEKSFLELFRTDEYSKLQGELVDLGIEIKSGFEKLMETVLSQYPVLLRSEADDLNRQIYELKKKVRDLEKQISGDSADEKKAVAKKTTVKTK